MSTIKISHEVTHNGQILLEEKTLRYFNIIAVSSVSRSIDQEKYEYKKVVNRINGEIMEEKLITDMDPEKFNKFQTEWRSKWTPVINETEACESVLKTIC